MIFYAINIITAQRPNGLTFFLCRTPLHCASSPHYSSTSGHAHVAQLLLEAGGEQLAFSLDENGNNALHVAAFNAEDAVARLLVLYFPGLVHVRNYKGRSGSEISNLFLIFSCVDLFFSNHIP